MTRTIILLSVALTFGCGESSMCEGAECDEDAGGADAGTDGGGADAGPGSDAGADGGGADAGPGTDAGPDAGAGTDAGPDAGSSDAGPDAGPDAGGLTCLPSAVRFIPSGGSLTVGQLCDDVFVCAVDMAHATAINAASSMFVCSPTPKGPCGGFTCVYRDPGGPSVLDMSELDEICAVTLVSPTPDMICQIYL